jgi:hypothetical protein
MTLIDRAQIRQTMTPEQFGTWNLEPGTWNSSRTTA